MDDYQRKFNHLWKKQSGRCGVTGVLLIRGSSVDMHHVLSDTKVNRRLYPNFVSSVWNLCLIFHDIHMSKALPKHAPEWQIRMAEGLLATHPGIEYEMNMADALQEYCAEFMR